MYERIVVIGLGGTGSCLVRPLMRYLNYSKKFNGEIILVDGDLFELKNLERQEFDPNLPLNKAENWAIRLQEKFNELNISVRTDYVTDVNAAEIIIDGSLIMSCVDNHSTRKLLQDFCLKVDNCCLISSGNDFIDGNVQVFVRQNKKNITPKIYDYHEEIKYPEDKNPEEMSCEELAESEPQLLFANFMSAALMISSFYCVFNGHSFKPEVYFDIAAQAAVSRDRK